MLRRFLPTAAFVLIAGGLSTIIPAAADTNPTEFVRHLGNQALGVIRGDMTPAEKRSYFRRLFDEDFDVAEISRFVLGPYNRVASDAERQEFHRLLKDYLVLIYSQRFTQYRGESLNVTGSRADDQGGTVTSQIISPLVGPPIEVDWRLSVHDGLYKISDVVIDGVSMAASQRS